MRKITALHQLSLAIILAGSVLAALVLGAQTEKVYAQDESPICPPGFEWQRMSGVGCVQTDCAEMGGRYSYTVACICNDGFKTCSEPVDYSNFDAEFCGIHCPGWRLTACVDPEALCPGEEPIVQDPPTQEPPPEEPPVWEEPPREDYYPESPLEEFLLGDHAHAPSPGRAAVAAAAGAALVGASTLVQFFSQGGGTSLQKSAADLSQTAVKPSPEAPEPDDLRGTLAGLSKDAAEVVDKWPGGKKPPESKHSFDQPPSAIQPSETAPGTEIFYGEAARAILIEMGKILPDRSLKVGSEGLGIYTGPHREGLIKRVTLPSGREIFVKEITALGVEGLPDPPPVLMEVGFDEKVALTALLAPPPPEDALDAPTIRPPEPDDPLEAPTIRPPELDDPNEAPTIRPPEPDDPADAPTIMRKDLDLPDDDEDGKEAGDA